MDCNYEADGLHHRSESPFQSFELKIVSLRTCVGELVDDDVGEVVAEGNGGGPRVLHVLNPRQRVRELLHHITRLLTLFTAKLVHEHLIWGDSAPSNLSPIAPSPSQLGN